MNDTGKNLCAVGFHRWARELKREGRRSLVLQICERCGKRGLVLSLRSETHPTDRRVRGPHWEHEPSHAAELKD